jgi:hypothetical protein
LQAADSPTLKKLYKPKAFTLIVKLRFEGGVLPMIVDTGAPVTLLDKSLESKLGNRVGTTTVYSFVCKQEAGVYAAPRFYVDSVPLMSGSNLLVCDLKKLSPRLPSVLGILGMDCLRHYCIQLDFEAGKMRFRDSDHLTTPALGKIFPLVFAKDADDRGPEIRPVLQHVGLLGGTAGNLIIDTGNNQDGMVAGRPIRRHAAGSYSGGFLKRVKHFLAVEGLVNRTVALPGCVWAGNTYRDIAVGRGPRESPNWIGLRFLARHLVTLDFPNRTMYLKQTSAGPLIDVNPKAAVNGSKGPHG